MQCPYCQAPAFETTPHCPRCGFSLERVDAYFGQMPRISPDVTDLAGLFRASDFRRINDARERLKERFPQITFSVAAVSLKPEQPLTAYAFWIFNKGGICVDLMRGGKSRNMLLTLDAASARASLMIGYGLEPFVAANVLQEIVNQGAPHFARDHWVDGIVSVIDAASARLADIFGSLGRVYGLDMADVQQDESPAAAPPAKGSGVY